jgi:hypothetical protein
MKLKLSLMIITTLCSLGVSSQIRYAGKVETGYLTFMNRIIRFDAGENWKGYNLRTEQNAVDVNLINGVRINDKFFTGIGLEYVNFEGINGGSVFADLEYLPFDTKVSISLNLKMGYNHIWNQYENGTGSVLLEPGASLTYRITERYRVYLKSGLLIMQQATIFPVRIGVGF